MIEVAMSGVMLLISALGIANLKEGWDPIEVGEIVLPASMSLAWLALGIV